MSALFQATEPPRLDIGDVHAQWLTEYGESWARRNPKTAPELDAVYMQNFRQTRTALTERFLAGVPRDARVLEVGCAAGAQLDVLARLGFSDLTGCDLSPDAIRDCPFPALPADATALPFADRAFDLVFTSGTLMHIPPFTRLRAIREVLRVARRWVWGFEPYSATPQTAFFGGLIPPAWPADFVALYRSEEPGLRVVREEVCRQPGRDMVYRMFLLARC